MQNREQIKFNARRRLSLNWSTIIASMAIVFISTFILTYIITFATMLPQLAVSYSSSGYYNSSAYLLSVLLAQFVMMLLFIFILYPLTYGWNLSFLKLARGYDPEIKDIFYYFRSAGEYKRLLIYNLLIFVRLLWFMIVVAGFIGLVYLAEMNYIYWLYPVAFILYIAGIIGFVVFTLRYSLSFIALCENPQLSPNEAIVLSTKLTKGHLGEIFKFSLYFIGWVMFVSVYGSCYYYTSYYIFTTQLYDYELNRHFGGNPPSFTSSREEAAQAPPVQPYNDFSPEDIADTVPRESRFTTGEDASPPTINYTPFNKNSSPLDNIPEAPKAPAPPELTDDNE